MAAVYISKQVPARWRTRRYFASPRSFRREGLAEAKEGVPPVVGEIRLGLDRQPIRAVAMEDQVVWVGAIRLQLRGRVKAIETGLG